LKGSDLFSGGWTKQQRRFVGTARDEVITLRHDLRVVSQDEDYAVEFVILPLCPSPASFPR
jgi:hypothetical protein